MSPAPLFNPERDWQRPPGARDIDRSEIERRIGSVIGPVTVLSGGLANASVLVDGKVLKVFRREPGVAALEARLLEQGFTSFRVPRVLSRGEDFLLLEYVAKGPLLGSAEHGVAVGRALAEIHAVKFEASGFLDAGLRVIEPFPDLVKTLIDYTRGELEKEPICDEVVAVLERHAPAMRENAGEVVLVHADFKASNLHWADDDRLLVLDWEFAYAGSALSDIGQLLRWDPPEPFIEAFGESYVASGGELPAGWRNLAALFDLVNLAGLFKNQFPVGSSDITRRIEKTLAASASAE